MMPPPGPPPMPPGAQARFAPALTVGPPVESPRGGQFAWLQWPWIVVLVFLPLAILALAEERDRAGLILAYINVAIIGTAIIYFIKQHNFAAMVPVLFIGYLFFCWPAATIYMGLFSPENRYVMIDETYRRCLDGNVRVQLAAMVHVLCYLLMIFLLAPRSGPVGDFAQRDRAGTVLGVLAAVGAIFSTGLHVVGQMSSSAVIGYLGIGAFIYLNGFPFVVGALFPRVPIAVRVALIGFLCCTAVFYLVGGGRTWAILPFLLLTLGAIFYSAYKQRTRMMIAAALLIGMPIIIVAGETTQILLGSKGWERFDERAAALKENWRGNLAEGSTLGRTFSRTFSTGGHSLITLTPDYYDYVPFVAGDFAQELITTIFVPGRLYGARYYSWTGQLKRYGFRITEKTSVELSFVGSLWMIGGWLPVILGSLYVGLIHAIAMRWIHRAAQYSPYKGLFYLSMIAYSVFWASNLDVITHTRMLLLAGIAGWLVWHIVILPIIGDVRPRRAPRGFPVRLATPTGRPAPGAALR